MDKRLAKRHKRQVARAKERAGQTEPDLRTPEQIKAAREASRAAFGSFQRGKALTSAPSFRNSRPPVTGGASKTDA
jgi:hypothetical protein